ncbi:hydrogenase maturation protein HypF [Thalassobacillus cyri]|uniref:Carbamoyltransferase n=1 Tax=Thalassobacillus cyri TaxID=571932 RepID=A0A1H3Z493_9BACI|nr:carbamoyltransferase HypF [Thalassobacillus cyri]SEA18609.1 hydrogenase maturation protein HypF [Thalassobacillus cyri]
MAKGKLGGANTGKRLRLDVTGVVQGVGFRPYIYRLAQKNHLTGFVLNNAGKVSIEVEGRKGDIDAFYHALKTETAAPARIDALKGKVLFPSGDENFSIKQSEKNDKAATAFPADLAVCEECLAEIHDETSRYYQYPFTSCTYCGPRYTVIEKLPYDRKTTSMSTFVLCEDCQQVYEDPNNRRFHAQTIACPVCGPQMKFVNENGKEQENDWLRRAADVLGTNGTLAVKGIGGFHLMCNALSKQAIERLRKRKNRPSKPLALMAGDINVIEQYFNLDETERKALKSPQAPIVLLTPKQKAKEALPLDAIAPGLYRIGVMMAYTPLHHLLFTQGPELIIATSGNRSGLPIAKTNDEALTQLKGMVEGFLIHDRAIVTRIDDSVGQSMNGQFSLIRRARGFVPDSISIPTSGEAPAVLGAGAEMKNTFCVLDNDKALLSQHIGDIDSLESLASYQERLDHVLSLSEKNPEVIAYDPHPAYMISKELTAGLENPLPVYHHHAHMAACMAEHQLETPVIGCILDGTGYGTDGTMWGFEILTGDYSNFERNVHLQPVSLPGGEAAIRHPWMMAVSLIYEAVEDKEMASKTAAELFTEYQVPLVAAQLQGSQGIRVSSAGRLFDAVAAMLGLCKKSSYEGEAAVLLSEMMEKQSLEPETSDIYEFTIAQGEWKIDGMIQGILADIHHGIAKETIAAKFHHTIAEMVCAGVCIAAGETSKLPVVLSGGVWQNRYLVKVTKHLLEQHGYSEFTHRQVPAGDGNIALGQAAVAKWRCSKNNVSINAGKGR